MCRNPRALVISPARRRRAARLLGACLLALVVAPVALSAQTGSGGVQSAEVRRPFRGLFGVPGLPGSKQTLDLTGSFYGAYDQNVYADQAGLDLASGLRKSGWFGGMESGLNYTRRGRRAAFSANAGLGVTDYPGEPLFVAYQGGATLNTPLKRNMSLSASESFSYAPEYRLGLFESPTGTGFVDPFGTVDTGLGLFREPSYRTNTNLGVAYTFRDQTSLSGFYSLSTAKYESRELNYINQGAGIRYQRQLTRNAGLHVGYAYGGGRYPNNETFDRRGIHNIDVGVDYGRALSISRRTHLSFSTGSALFYVSQGVSNGPNRRLDFAVIGSANLSHEMGRTWSASASYQRSVAFHEGFLDPFLTQSASGALRGLLSRRLTFESTVSYSRGATGAAGNSNFDSAGANAGLQYAVSRYLAAYTNYIYYRHLIPAGLAIDPRFPLGLSRNGVRFGVTTSIPLIRGK